MNLVFTRLESMLVSASSMQTAVKSIRSRLSCISHTDFGNWQIGLSSISVWKASRNPPMSTREGNLQYPRTVLLCYHGSTQVLNISERRHDQLHGNQMNVSFVYVCYNHAELCPTDNHTASSYLNAPSFQTHKHGHRRKRTHRTVLPYPVTNWPIILLTFLANVPCQSQTTFLTIPIKLSIIP